MKHILPLIAYMLLCLNAQAKNKTDQGFIYQPHAVCGDASDGNYPEYHDCFERLESAAIKTAKGQIIRDKDTLCLKPQTGEKICFSNLEASNEGSEIAHYYYFGHPLDLKDVAVIHLKSGAYNMDEFGEYFFISLNNGKLLAHMPSTAQQLVFSSDKRFLAGYNALIVYYPTQLKIWRIDHSQNPKAWNIEVNLVGVFEKITDMQYDAQAVLAWESDEGENLLTLKTPNPSHGSYTIKHFCTQDMPIYDPKVEIIDKQLKFSEYENPCDSGSWMINFIPKNTP